MNPKYQKVCAEIAKTEKKIEDLQAQLKELYDRKTEMEMLKDYPDVMSIEQMCEILSISTKTGYRILREGKILSLKVGRAYRIPKAHLFTYLCIGCGETVNA